MPSHKIALGHFQVAQAGIVALVGGDLPIKVADRLMSLPGTSMLAGRIAGEVAWFV